VTLPGIVKRLQPIIINFLYRNWRWSATEIERLEFTLYCRCNSHCAQYIRRFTLQNTSAS